jgi:endoglucanase
MVGGGAALVVLAALLYSTTCDAPAPTEATRHQPAGESDGVVSELAGRRLFVDPDSRALETVDAWQRTRPADAALIDSMARTPQGIWFNGWQSDTRAAANRAVGDAAAAGAVPLLVVYNIPERDCGEYSAGGAVSPAEYRDFIGDIASGIAGYTTLIVLEPDALAGYDCLSAKDRDTRLALLREATETLASAGAWVYIDAGNPGWQSAAEMARRLEAAGVAQAAGFALNVSNFITTEDNIEFGDAVSRLTGGKHYLIDTSRNGLGPVAGDIWCNPPGRAVGTYPTTATGRTLVDAYVWVKNPGDSDGPCNGGPEAGEWWPDYALGLMRRAPATSR